MDGTAEETISGAMARLARAGYDHAFHPEGDWIRSAESGRRYRPDDLVIDELLRFEGPTDPADEVVLLALRAPADCVRGTLTLPFGPGADAESADLLRALRSAGRYRRANSPGPT